MKRIIPPMIGLLAIAGLADSAYLVLRHYEILGAEPYIVAAACEVAKVSCETAVQSNAGDILGVPAPVLGGLYFAAMAVIALASIHFGRWLFPYATLAFLTAGLAYSGYLVYSLVAVLDEPCPYCLAAHSINVAAFVLFIVSLRSEVTSRRTAS